MRMYQNDLLPELVVRLADDNGPVDLTAASAIRVIGVQNSEVVFDRSVTGSADGIVNMPWEAGDTDETGRIRLEVVVTWNPSKPQTFRVEETVDVKANYASAVV